MRTQYSATEPRSMPGKAARPWAPTTSKLAPAAWDSKAGPAGPSTTRSVIGTSGNSFPMSAVTSCSVRRVSASRSMPGGIRVR